MVSRSLKIRVVTSTALVATTLAVLLLLVARHFAYTNLKDLLQTQQDAQVKSVAEQLNDKFEVRATILRRLSDQISTRLERGPDELKHFSLQAVAIPEIFDWVFLLGLDGEEIFDSAPTGRHLNFSDRKWFQDISQRNEALAISAPLVAKATSAPSVIMAVPVRAADGHLLAVLAGGLNLQHDNFLGQLSRSRIGRTGTYCLVAPGHVPHYVMHADVSRVLQPASASGESCGAAGVASLWAFTGLTQPIVAKHPVKAAGWELVGALPGEEAYAPFTRARPRVFLTAATALLGVILFMWLRIRRQLVPLERLHRIVSESTTDVSAYTRLAPASADEIGNLTTAFSGLMRALSERTIALEEASQLAEAREHRIHAIANQIPDFVAYLDADERYVFVNNAYERQFGIPIDKIIGMTTRELWGDAIYSRNVKPHIDIALSGRSITFDSELDNKGTYQCYEVTYQPAWNSQRTQVTGIHIFSKEVTRDRQKVQQLEQLMQSDSLTGLLNRAGFEQHLVASMAKVGESRKMMALLLIDLDAFKEVNDSYGHAFGDELLRFFAMRLRSCTRESDAVARIGGDEFAVILDDISKPDAAERVAHAIAVASSKAYAIDGRSVTCSASIGAVLHGPEQEDAKSELFLKADTALYAAKHAGKGRFVLFGTAQAPSVHAGFRAAAE